jgi:hypothetical protein
MLLTDTLLCSSHVLRARTEYSSRLLGVLTNNRAQQQALCLRL